MIDFWYRDWPSNAFFIEICVRLSKGKNPCPIKSKISCHKKDAIYLKWRGKKEGGSRGLELNIWDGNHTIESLNK